MPRYIMKLNDKYLEWSTVVDAPITYGMTEEEFREFYIEQYGKSRISELDERLARVNEFGISSYGGMTVDEVIEGNRAGPDETFLTKEQIIEEFCK